MYTAEHGNLIELLSFFIDLLSQQTVRMVWYKADQNTIRQQLEKQRFYRGSLVQKLSQKHHPLANADTFSCCALTDSLTIQLPASSYKL